MKAMSAGEQHGGVMDGEEGQPWLEDCDRVVAEFNEVAIEAFRQEWGEGEEITIAMMQFHPATEGIQLDIGPRGAFLIENATGFVYKISSNGRIHYQKCAGHVTSVTGKDLYRQQWW